MLLTKHRGNLLTESFSKHLLHAFLHIRRARRNLAKVHHLGFLGRIIYLNLLLNLVILNHRHQALDLGLS